MPSASVQFGWLSREDARRQAKAAEGGFNAGDRAIIYRRAWHVTSTSDERANASAYNAYEAIARMHRFLTR